MNLETLTANEAEAVKRYLEPSFQVVLKPLYTLQQNGFTFIICNYCHMSWMCGDPFNHTTACPEYQAVKPKRVYKAITRIFHMTAYAEVDEKGGLIIP